MSDSEECAEIPNSQDLAAAVVVVVVGVPATAVSVAVTEN